MNIQNLVLTALALESALSPQIGLEELEEEGSRARQVDLLIRAKARV